MKVNQTLSTNDLLWEMLSLKQYENGFVLQAESQTKGKGQKGNTWRSEPGQNLTVSIFTVPKLNAKQVFYLNIITSLAIQKTLAHFSIEAMIKWPNDILVNNKKIAGILIENQVQGQTINKSVIGIGLNINQTTFPIDRPVTSISKELKERIDINKVLKILYQNLDYYFDLLINQYHSILKKQYLQHLYLKDVWHEFSNEKLGRFSGKIQGINEDGQLQIKTVDGIEHCFDIQAIRFL